MFSFIKNQTTNQHRYGCIAVDIIRQIYITGILYVWIYVYIHMIFIYVYINIILIRINSQSEHLQWTTNSHNFCRPFWLFSTNKFLRIESLIQRAWAILRSKEVSEIMLENFISIHICITMYEIVFHLILIKTGHCHCLLISLFDRQKSLFMYLIFSFIWWMES